MSDTPRTDAEALPWEEASFLGSKEVVSASFARDLEAELVLAQKELRAARELFAKETAILKQIELDYAEATGSRMNDQHD